VLARLCSINPQVVDEARRHLGSNLATVAVAVTFQKTTVNGGAKPGAYLRTLVQRGRAGQLFLSRSLFAMQAANARSPGRPQ
jgi:replication initiation protein RepC